MAYYDPYYTDPYGFPSYQYDYGDFYEDTPPPPPDIDWEDPVPVVRTYLNRIQPDCVLEDFKDLKETNIYALECLVGFVEFERDQVLHPIKIEEFNCQIKFPNLNFLDIDDANTSSVISHTSSSFPAFTDLFQNIFDTSKHQDQAVLATDKEVRSIDKDIPSVVSETQEETVSSSNVTEKDSKNLSRSPTVEVTSLQLNRG